MCVCQTMTILWIILEQYVHGNQIRLKWTKPRRKHGQMMDNKHVGWTTQSYEEKCYMFYVMIWGSHSRLGLGICSGLHDRMLGEMLICAYCMSL